ncbi:MAG: hypothetical protein U0S12_02380 [Fimbriimonadales bacterium]
MNGKLDKRLLELAFGDMNADEAESVRKAAANDAEAEATLRQYEAMKMDLLKLREVPAPQLSAERLRDRILTDGLRPKASVPWFSRYWLPVAASAFVVGFFVIQMKKPSVSVPSLVAANIEKPAPGLDFVPKADPGLKVAAAADASGATKPAAPKLASKTARRPRVKHDWVAKNDMPSPTLAGAMMKSPGTAGPSTSALNASSAAADTAMSASAPATEAEPLVLIQPDKDVDTGAQRATEVNANNVVIGG